MKRKQEVARKEKEERDKKYAEEKEEREHKAKQEAIRRASEAERKAAAADRVPTTPNKFDGTGFFFSVLSLVNFFFASQLDLPARCMVWTLFCIGCSRALMATRCAFIGVTR